jgi:hypothetical protein
MTLADLYNSIDWSGSEKTLKEWQAKNDTDWKADPEFARNWRLTLLLYSLPQQIVGDQAEEWSKEKAESARAALVHAGVWEQVVDYLIRNNLLDEVELTLLQKGKAWLRKLAN